MVTMTGKLVLPVQKNGMTASIYPKIFVYDESLKITDVVLSAGVVSAQFKIGSTSYTQTSLKNVTLVQGAELTIDNIVIGSGYDYAGLVIIFNIL